MGFVNASHSLCEFLTELLGNLPYVTIYYDDILIITKDKESMFTALEKVLGILDKGGLSVNPAKCVLFAKRVEFLGSEISTEGIQVLPSHVESIQRLKVPENVKDLKSFLGATQFVGDHIRSFGEWRRNLTPLLCKGAPWVWGKNQM